MKNLEKKSKAKAEFDKKNPESRKKSLNDAKLKKIMKAKSEDTNIQKVHKKKKLKIIQQIKQEVEKKIPTDDVEASDKLVKREVVKKAIIALKDGITKEIEGSDKKNLFDEELRLGLQIVATKIPQCPPHVRKILLDHSLFDHQPDICFIIRDQVPKKADQDENIRNFQEKLKEVDVDYVKTIIPLSQLKNDYKSHNLKLKLCNTYDVFLVESEIAEHVYTFLGKHFIVKRKRPAQIDTKKTSVLKICIDNAVKKVSFKLNSTSNLSCFEVGTIKMENVKIADNIMSSIDQLKEKWPGSWKNISRLHLKPMRPSKVTIPIYYSNVNPNDVEVPVIQGAKQNRLDKLAEELKKKSKKFKLDLKQKRLMKKGQLKDPKKEAGKKIAKKGAESDKSKAEATTESSEPTKNKKKNKDGKKPAVDESKTVEIPKKKKNKATVDEPATESAEPPKKKKVKVTENPIPSLTEPAKKKKNKGTDKQPAPEAFAEPTQSPKKKKNKNKKSAVADDQPSKKSKKNQVEPETVEPENEPAKKKKKIKTNLDSIAAQTTDEKPALVKKKNKNKSKADINNISTAPIVAEKDPIKKNKKKDKKNKA